jgi:5-methylcytosine-specific restriction endonuclease McrA
VSRTRNTPCISCGVLQWGPKGGKDAGQSPCFPCRRVSPEYKEAQAARRVVAERAHYAARCATVESRPCAQCGNEFTPNPTKAPRTCSYTCAQLLRNREGRGFNLYATDAEREAARLDVWQRKNRKRRALKRGVPSERYSLQEIADRDGYCCQLCGDPVPMDVKCPDPQAPTIDHVVPFALGGNDLRANVQLAHFSCNSRKGARAA